MSLTQALNSALSGLKVTQANIAMVAANVANADTPGYTRKVVNQIATGGNTSVGVRVSDIQREIDLVRTAAVAGRKRWRFLRRHARGYVLAIAGHLWPAGSKYRAGVGVQQFYDRRSIALDQSR